MTFNVIKDDDDTISGFAVVQNKTQTVRSFDTKLAATKFIKSLRAAAFKGEIPNFMFNRIR